MSKEPPASEQVSEAPVPALNGAPVVVPSQTPFDLVIEASQRRQARPATSLKPKESRKIRLDLDIDLDRLAMQPEDVARLTRPERDDRLGALIDEANTIVDTAIPAYIDADDRVNVATVVLFSGGNDSTVLAHLFRERATHAGMANTLVGIEQTRQYVRDTCTAWALPLLERRAPREEDSYREQVLRHGFPGPGRHGRMYQRLKERAFSQIQRELVAHPFQQRMVFLAGRRRTESDRRKNIVAHERIRSAVWLSPLVNWTKLDMNTYRLACGDVPVNRVSELIEMSGECLCGAMAHYNERAEVCEWFPEPFTEVIDELQDTIRAYPADFIHPAVIAEYERAVARGKKPSPPKPIPDYAKTWGWGGDPRLRALSGEKPTNGRLCGVGCTERYEQAALALDLEESAA